MGKYNFDRQVDRTCTSDLKWNRDHMKAYHYDAPDDMIPMWLADTDFACAPVIVNALRERVEKEIYGYCAPCKAFFDAVIYWEKLRFGWDVTATWISTMPSVVGGINAAVRAFSDLGDGVIIQTPVYDPFMKIVMRSGRTMVNNQLVCTDGHYTMNFDELEMMAAEPRNKVMVLCSPHNPVGRVWTPEELRRVAEICLRNHVVLVSDEIHSDIVYSGHKHSPILSLDKRYEQNFIHLSAASKSFNIAGLKFSVAIIPNEELRKRFIDSQLAISLDVKNTFGIEGTQAAYSPEGNEWLNEEVAYMEANANFAVEYIQANFKKITVRKPEGTFLLWLDYRGLGLTDEEFIRKVNMEAGVISISGAQYGKGGEQHLRVNIGTTRKNLQDALERIKIVFE